MNGSNGRGEGTGYDGVFKALGDAHRLQILELLSRKELSAGEILESMDIVQSTLSHHMKVLTDSGAVTATRCGKWTVYAVNEDVLRGAEHYLDDFLSRSAYAESSVLLAPGGRKKEAAGAFQTAEEGKENIASEEKRKENIPSAGSTDAGTDGGFVNVGAAAHTGKDNAAEKDGKQEERRAAGKVVKAGEGNAAGKNGKPEKGGVTEKGEKAAKAGKDSFPEKGVKTEEKKKGKKGKKSKKNGKK